MYRLGITGTMAFTAPEHFLEANFSKDHFQAEVFTLGVALYSMYTGVLPIWVDHIEEVRNDIDFSLARYTKSPADLLKAQSTLRALVKQHVDDTVAVKALMDKKRLHHTMTQKEEILWLINSMLLSDPKERITLEKARIEIRRIIISHPPRRRVMRRAGSKRPLHELLPHRLRSPISVEPLLRLEALMRKTRISVKEKDDEKFEKPTPKAAPKMTELFQQLALDEV